MAKAQYLDIPYEFIDNGNGELMLIIDAPEGDSDNENAKFIFNGTANAGMLYRNSEQIIRLPSVNSEVRDMLLDGRSIVLVSEMNGEDINDVYEAKLEILNKDSASETKPTGGIKIDVENSYGIYQNSKNEIMFSVLERDSDQDNPKLLYDGGEHALLLRNGGHAVLLDYINKEVRRSLLEAKEVLIAEHPKDEKEKFVREYMAPVNIVKELPVKYVEQPQKNNYDDDAPEKAGERIRRMLRDDPGMVPRVVQFYTDMANDGNAGAQYELANLYLEGLGVEKDEAKAFDLIKKSAQNGHPQAIEFLKDAKKRSYYDQK